MKFHELLTKYSNTEIIEGLKVNFDDINEEAYISALQELRVLKPSTEIQDIKIVVEFFKDDYDKDNEEIYLSCDGIGLNEDGEMIRWAIEFNDWEDWLAQEIEESCFNKLSEITILAGIIWELTYNGYSQEDLASEKDKLMNSIKEMKEHPENMVKLDLDKMMRELEGSESE